MFSKIAAAEHKDHNRVGLRPSEGRPYRRTLNGRSGEAVSAIAIDGGQAAYGALLLVALDAGRMGRSHLRLRSAKQEVVVEGPGAVARELTALELLVPLTQL